MELQNSEITTSTKDINIQDKMNEDKVMDDKLEFEEQSYP
jgi:hypothetical protein